MIKNALALFVLTIVVVLVYLPSYTKMQELKQKNHDFSRRIQELEAKNKKLEEEHQALMTDPAYVEKIGREKMGLIREGETVYKIIPEEQKR